MALDPGDEVVIRAALRDEVSRPVSEIRQELGQLRLALNVVAEASRRTADALERIERNGAGARREVRRTASASRAAARGLSDYARQANQAARATVRMTGAVLGLNAALRGTRGLVGALRGVQGETKLLIALFATLIPAAVPVAAVLTGAFLSAGGAASVLVASLGVLVLALSGTGEAISALASGDMDKINEAMAKLTDTGQEFATYVFSLRPVLDQLRGVAQITTLPGLQSALEILVTTLPNVTELVAALGGAIGGAAVQMAEAFAGPGGQAFVDFLTAQAPTLNAFTGGLISLTGSLALLFQAFAPLSTVVNAALGGVLGDFRAFSDGTTGRLQQFIGYIEQAMGPVGDFLTGFGRTLLDLLEALGQPGLVVLGAVNDLLGLLSTLAPLVGDIAQAIGIGLAGVFQALIPVVEALAPVLGDVLITAVTGIAAALIALAPAVGELAQFLGDALLVGVQALVPYLEPLGEAFLGVLSALAPLVPIALSLIPVLGDTLLAVFAALTPAIATLVPVIGQLAVDLLTALLPVLPILANLLAGVLTALTPLLPVLGDALLQILAAVIPELPGLADGLLQVLNAATPLIDPVLQLVLAFVPLLPPVLELATSLLPLIASLLQVLTPLVVDFADAFTDNLVPVVQILGDALEWVAGLLQDLAGWISENAGALGDTLKLLTTGSGGEIFSSWKDGVASIFGGGSSGGRRGAGGSFGDTGSPRANLTGTLAVHSALTGGGGPQITNALTGGGGRGPGSGDHQDGRALDLKGPGLNDYRARLIGMGGYAAFHGSGAGRHLHAVYPKVRTVASTSARTQAVPALAGSIGDTGTSMASRMGGMGADAFGGAVSVSVNVQVVNPSANVDVAAAVAAGTRAAIEEYRRELAETRSTRAF